MLAPVSVKAKLYKIFLGDRRTDNVSVELHWRIGPQNI